MDFTLTKYFDLLKAINRSGIQVYGVSEWCAQKPTKGILVRHDVDRKPQNSLKIAQIEAETGIYTTYYFRITNNSYHPEIIKKISKLGHEVGYHYEDLSFANGDIVEAEKLFLLHLKMFRQFCDIKTIAMHGRPMSKYDNRDLWKKLDFRKYDIESEAFLSINYKDMYYFTDTGRSWSNKAINLRDKVESLNVEFESTEELIEFIKNNKERKIAITTHPERWNDIGLGYFYSYFIDMLANVVKKLLSKIYNI